MTQFEAIKKLRTACLRAAMYLDAFGIRKVATDLMLVYRITEYAEKEAEIAARPVRTPSD